MKQNIICKSLVAWVVMAMASCSDNYEEKELSGSPESCNVMTFSFNHPGATKATDSSFEPGDKVGLFVTDSDTGLELAGNVVNNQALQFDGSRWEASRKLYWDNGFFNAYAYYPYLESVNSVTDLMFEVSTDQSIEKSGSSLSGYESSDLLYSSVKGIKSSEEPVNMTFRHILSKISIRLIKGEDYEGDLPENAKVVIHNTVTTATVDLSAGVATKYDRGERKSIVARQTAPTSYSAIIIPQRLDNRVPLIEVITDGISFIYDSKFLFKPGIHHMVNLVLDKNPEQVKIEIGGEIVNWE